MCSQRGLVRLQLDYEIYTDTVDKLSSEVSGLMYKHDRLKLIKADTYDLAQEIRALGIKKARAEGKAVKIKKVLNNKERKPLTKGE